MASLIEELINTLSEELDSYNQILEVTNAKTDIIIRGDVSALQEITEKEQNIAGRLARLEKKRESHIEDISLVININSKELSLTKLVELLKGQEKERKELMDINNQLKETIEELQNRSEQNKALINQSLDLIDFTINAIRTSRVAPQTAGYENKGKAFEGNTNNAMFDAKQ
ncbi:FlgN protein [Natranaerovirga pectinivora]|uniref:FlgN protein n=1 Tax=Natranaerovirga pectinivora TaxID=682400 RepID=A0A4R3MJ23_9FIRM|nr:flagellar protein FlgN [Natranaerovirga pectinivora]TCT14013.1 FlgN protein [Natranaerovirga pectinivora]